MSALFPDVVVNGEVIPAAQIAAEAQNHQGPQGKPGIAWRKAANAVAVRALLRQAAKKRGVVAHIRETGPDRFETEEEALIRGLLDQVIQVSAPSANEVEAEWQRDPSRFRAPPLWNASHILVACDPRQEAARTKAHTRAIDLTQRAQARPNTFAQLATDTSDCTSKSNGGALGQLTPGDTVPEFEAALHLLADGQITAQPVLTRYGWHIIKMNATAPGAVLPFDAVKDKIGDAMEKAAWSRSARDFVQDLAASAEITGADLKPVTP